ncbi:MAG: T9SS type A sorting domain-containing protein [Flavobacteriales bacterium]|nr:T9SS type A sorting domain-containing protein [Flavobacteriales bacterium]MCB9363934.1 T9SS type A sorting domain-containing protein [Flavobacteriales bacterium]
MKNLIFTFFTIFFTLSFYAQNSRSDTTDVLNYEINLDFTNMGNQQIKGNCKVKFTPKINGISQIKLDLLNLVVDSIVGLNGILTYTYNDTLLNIDLGTNLNTTDTSEVIVYYHGLPQQDASGWGGFYFQGNYAFNLGVGFDANPHNYGRVWFPCFDNFVERSTYEFNIITSGGKNAHCNGALISENVINGDTITRKWVMNEEIPSYLVCVAIADYATVHQSHNGLLGNIPIELVARPSDTTNMKNSFVHLPDAIDIYETGYGPYQWNKVGFSLVPFGSGAMEHATNIAYPQSAANGGLGSETLMAHEFAHHWWGDLVTCETAGDMWINEGMATYSEYLFTEKVYDYETALEQIKNSNKSILQFLHINEGGYMPISGVPHEYTYGDRVYKKGALMAHNMRAYLGDSLFFYGLNEATNTFKFQSMNSSQFRDELTSKTGVNMVPFFNDWIFSPGYAHYEIDSTKITPNGGDFDVEIFIEQKLRGNSVFHTQAPLEITFYDSNWNRVKRTVMTNGQFSSGVVTIPFQPTLTLLNEDNKLNQARTDDKLVITSTGTKSLNRSLFNLTTTSAVDSALLFIQHHWVKPDAIQNNPNNYRISESRYWSVKGFMPANYDATAKIYFDGRYNSGYLDVDLAPVSADSIILLYRENASQDWSVYPYYTKTTLASNYPYGWMIIDSLLLGDYAFANGDITTGLNPIKLTQEEVKVYPNPSDSFITVHLEKQIKNATVQVYNLTGKLIIEKPILDKLKLNIGNIIPQTYILHIIQEGKSVYNQKIVIQ